MKIILDCLNYYKGYKKKNFSWVFWWILTNKGLGLTVIVQDDMILAFFACLAEAIVFLFVYDQAFIKV